MKIKSHNLCLLITSMRSNLIFRFILNKLDRPKLEVVLVEITECKTEFLYKNYNHFHYYRVLWFLLYCFVYSSLIGHILLKNLRSICLVDKLFSINFKHICSVIMIACQSYFSYRIYIIEGKFNPLTITICWPPRCKVAICSFGGFFTRFLCWCYYGNWS